MAGPEFALSYDCPHCKKQWTETANVRRDSDCPRCGTVSGYTRARVVEPWPWPTSRAPQVPYRSELTPAGEQLVIPGCERNLAPTARQLDLF